MIDKDNEFESFMDDNFEDFYNNLPKKIWEDINNLTTVTNAIGHDYVDTEKTGKYIYIDYLIENLILNNPILFPHQNKSEWDELIYEFEKLLGTTATEEEQFKLGIYPDEIKFIRSYLKEKITPDTPFEYWECSHQFDQSLYNALTKVWSQIINSIESFQKKDIDLSKSVSLDKLASRADFREIIKKRPLIYFYIDENLTVPKKNKLKLFPHCKLTFKNRSEDFYEFLSEGLHFSNDYSINYKNQSIQINSIFLNKVALTDISNRQIIVPTHENIEYLQESLKDIQSYLILPICNYNISLHFNQAHILNKQLIELGINQPIPITKTEQRNQFLIQLLNDNKDLICIDGITCTITKNELWGKCQDIDRQLFSSGKDDFFNKSKNPKIPEIIKFESGVPKKNQIDK